LHSRGQPLDRTLNAPRLQILLLAVFQAS
jgi:hypothetical protein